MEFELKHVFNNSQQQGIIEFVKSRCIPDPKYQAAKINSIYFDSLDLHSLDEKLNSDFYKTKYRLRWYQERQTENLSETAFMEVKQREGGTRSKQRIVSSLTPKELHNMQLDDPRLLNMPHELIEHNIFCQWQLFPAILIEYTRMRFIDPIFGYRISIDFDIHARKFNSNMLPRALPNTLNSGVLEVKGDSTELPRTLKPLINLGLRKASFSKYLACYANSHQVKFDPR